MQEGDQKQKLTLVKKINQLERELNEALLNGQFINQVAPVKAIFKAESMRALLKALTKAYKIILNTKRTNFYFIN